MKHCERAVVPYCQVYLILRTYTSIDIIKYLLAVYMSLYTVCETVYSLCVECMYILQHCDVVSFLQPLLGQYAGNRLAGMLCQHNATYQLK